MLFGEKTSGYKRTTLKASESSNQTTSHTSPDLHYIRGSHSLADMTIDLDNNVEGLDWTKIAERVCEVTLIYVLFTKICYSGQGF